CRSQRTWAHALAIQIDRDGIVRSTGGLVIIDMSPRAVIDMRRRGMRDSMATRTAVAMPPRPSASLRRGHTLGLFEVSGHGRVARPEELRAREACSARAH